MLNKSYFFLFTGFLLFIISCKEKNENNEKQEMPIVKVYEDTIKRDLPYWYAEYTDVQDRMKKAHEMLGLKRLYGGFDSLQIRIEFECADTSNIISISKTGGKWRAVFHFFKFTFDEDQEPKSVSHWKEEGMPKSGWVKFSDSLLKTGIIDLPDYSTFKSYPVFATDEEGVKVEIASANIYKLYHYPALQSHTYIKEGPAKLDEAIKLIEREFKFKRACE